VRFAALLDSVACAAPKLRVRFVSPHPKDFSDDVLAVIRERNNVCKQVHLPAQSGSTRVLAAMRRGYSREAYLALTQRIRDLVPGVALSSDFISGFCGETEADHQDTLSLMRAVRFEQAYMFAYSRRERTHAAYHLVDDVSEAEKNRRLREVIDVFRAGALERHAEDVGSLQLVLVDGPARKSTPEVPLWAGRTDSNKKCIFAEMSALPSISAFLSSQLGHSETVRTTIAPGQFVAVQVVGSGETSLRAVALAVTSLAEFSAMAPSLLRDFSHSVTHARLR
jgi:tRNA A37 methylthiotransferase MiaB